MVAMKLERGTRLDHTEVEAVASDDGRGREKAAPVDVPKAQSSGVTRQAVVGGGLWVSTLVGMDLSLRQLGIRHAGAPKLAALIAVAVAVHSVMCGLALSPHRWGGRRFEDGAAS